MEVAVSKSCNPGARQLQVLLVERRWRGGSERTDCGLAGYDQCQLSTDLTLQLSLDIRQCRLQQFRSNITHNTQGDPSARVWTLD